MHIPLVKNPSGTHIENRTSHDIEPTERAGRQERQLVIGLLNNMSAIEATERQFTSLLQSASHGFSILLKRYYMPEVAKSESAALYRDRHYESVESLWDAELDGLIVTGREPLTPNLRDEPYWDSFVRVLEWARENTHSAIWSCLAAHAAVLHMDGIPRARSEQKCSGIFDCTRVSDHPIAAKVPARLKLPHSRWNGLDEADLTRCGYEVITRTDDAGVDCFIKQERSLFVFFQGHPEYQSETLLLEYRRDLGRFLRGESVNYPGVPRGYFNEQALQELAEIQRQAAERPPEATLTRLAALFAATGKENGWHATASTVYRNWLEYISSEKQLREEISPAATVTSPADALASAGAP
jgi:homoserine O-succinyltransferase/O-acetyltransferase